MLRERGRVRPGTRLLEVAPIRTVENTARELGYDYVSVDLNSAAAQVHGDLGRLPFRGAVFDLVVCFHVLEHIVDDRAAVTELARVVGIGGKALVVVPRNESWPATFEDPDASPEDYERLYGQSDHVRIYGSDIVNRWSETGVDVRVQHWTECFTRDAHRRAVLTGEDDRFWVLRATRSAQDTTCECDS
jgi:SAM-dependent methyltransferase